MSIFHVISELFSSNEPVQPKMICGYTVDYNSPISEPCLGCGGQTYRSVENKGIACCTRCFHILEVFPDY